MKKNVLFWSIAIAVLVLDQISKYWVVTNFNLKDTFPLWEGVIHFTYIRNSGAAYGIFSGGVGWLRWLSLIASLALIALACFGGKLNKLEQLAYGLILAGAFGNGIDRFLFGYVVDFIEFRGINFPLFQFVCNIADISVSCGFIFLILAIFNVPFPPSSSPKK